MFLRYRAYHIINKTKARYWGIGKGIGYCTMKRTHYDEYVHMYIPEQFDTVSGRSRPFCTAFHGMRDTELSHFKLLSIIPHNIIPHNIIPHNTKPHHITDYIISHHNTTTHNAHWPYLVEHVEVVVQLIHAGRRKQLVLVYRCRWVCVRWEIFGPWILDTVRYRVWYGTLL